MENNRSFYNEILTDHNLHPMHKHPLDTATASLEGVNPSCGDDIVLNPVSYTHLTLPTKLEV
mgnify:CR=1 FL=1